MACSKLNSEINVLNGFVKTDFRVNNMTLKLVKIQILQPRELRRCASINLAVCSGKMILLIYSFILYELMNKVVQLKSK